jgi:hypothetical protein
MIPFQADADRQCGHRHRYVGPEEAILAYSWLTGQPTIIFQDGLNERCPEVGLWEFRPITRRGFFLRRGLPRKSQARMLR